MDTYFLALRQLYAAVEHYDTVLYVTTGNHRRPPSR
jgi:hypothetical protein